MHLPDKARLTLEILQCIKTDTSLWLLEAQVLSRKGLISFPIHVSMLGVFANMCVKSGHKQGAYVSECLNPITAELQFPTDGKWA